MNQVEQSVAEYVDEVCRRQNIGVSVVGLVVGCSYSFVNRRGYSR